MARLPGYFIRKVNARESRSKGSSLDDVVGSACGPTGCAVPFRGSENRRNVRRAPQASVEGQARSTTFPEWAEQQVISSLPELASIRFPGRTAASRSIKDAPYVLPLNTIPILLRVV